MNERLWCEFAWLPDGPVPGVAITVDGSRITSVEPGAPREGTVLTGLTLPGFANAHSHAFHRALRGRTHADGGTFWTWRERMYAVAERLEPETYRRLARAVFAEMVLAGFTSVGEFHYLHHAPGGRPYADPNEMGHALAQAAAEAGIRLTLLDTCYLTPGLEGGELSPAQRRFSDGDAERWAARVDEFRPSGLVRVRAAVHSVRAVPAEQIPVVASWASGRPLHAHLSEQRAENEACRRVHGRSPSELLADLGVLRDDFVAVHATHLTDKDVALLSGSGVCFCPTTERDLGDGIGPARRLADAGATLSLGSDSHAVVDPFAEILALEADERLATESRGHFTPGELVAAAARHEAIGWPEVGKIAAGWQADLVVIDTESVRTAGSEPVGVPLCATGAEVRHVMIAGEWTVHEGRHQRVERPAAELAAAIGELL